MDRPLANWEFGNLLACVASIPVRGEHGLPEGVFRIRAV